MNVFGMCRSAVALWTLSGMLRHGIDMQWHEEGHLVKVAQLLRKK